MDAVEYLNREGEIKMGEKLVSKDEYRMAVSRVLDNGPIKEVISAKPTVSVLLLVFEAEVEQELFKEDDEPYVEPQEVEE